MTGNSLSLVSLAPVYLHTDLHISCMKIDQCKEHQFLVPFVKNVNLNLKKEEKNQASNLTHGSYFRQPLMAYKHLNYAMIAEYFIPTDQTALIQSLKDMSLSIGKAFLLEISFQR